MILDHAMTKNRSQKPVTEGRRAGPVHLDEETRAAVREGQEQARRGEFVSDEDMAAFFRHHNVW